MMSEVPYFAAKLYFLYKGGKKLEKPELLDEVVVRTVETGIRVFRAKPCSKDDEGFTIAFMIRPYDVAFYPTGIWIMGMDAEHLFQEWLLTTLTAKELEEVGIWW